jgi:CMP/dCMP kinase
VTLRVIAIDGPAASGKSSTASLVARRLGWTHLDSGALYRAITLGVLDNLGEQGAGSRERWSAERIVALAEDLPVRLVLVDDVFRPEVAGVDVAQAIRSERVTQRVSEIAAIPEVRHWVNVQQREAVQGHPRGVVVDGRDIGTVVFPDAPLKVFLTASPEERARRRLAERGAGKGGVGGEGDAELRREVAVLEARDRADSTRAVAPLRAAADAVVLDTTRLSLEQQVQAVVALARTRLPG